MDVSHKRTHTQRCAHINTLTLAKARTKTVTQFFRMLAKKNSLSHTHKHSIKDPEKLSSSQELHLYASFKALPSKQRAGWRASKSESTKQQNDCPKNSAMTFNWQSACPTNAQLLLHSTSFRSWLCFCCTDAAFVVLSSCLSLQPSDYRFLFFCRLIYSR